MAGGDTASGDTASGDTAGGDTADGNTAGGDTASGDTAGGDNTVSGWNRFSCLFVIYIKLHWLSDYLTLWCVLWLEGLCAGLTVGSSLAPGFCLFLR